MRSFCTSTTQPTMVVLGSTDPMVPQKRKSIGVGNGSDKRSKVKLPLNDADVESRLENFRNYVAKHIPPSREWKDPGPAYAVDGGCVLIGNKHHAADLPNLLKLGVTAVLNCASGTCVFLVSAIIQQ